MDLSANVEACRRLARAVSIPLMADADTGYGNAVSVAYAVRYFEDAGVVGINIEDQVWPKRCGHLAGKEVIAAREMAKKIESAVNARRDKDFIVVARTDAIGVEGIEGAVARAVEYAAAGADMIYPDGVQSIDDVRKIVDATVLPVSIGVGFGIRPRLPAPSLSIKSLQACGVARICVPRILPGAAIRAMKQALGILRDGVNSAEVENRSDLIAGMDEINMLMGYRDIERLESEYLLDEQLEAKYRGDRKPRFDRGLLP